MAAAIGANRWQIVSVAVLVECCAGLGYIFSVYSSDLKAQFGLTQERLDLLGTLSNLGGNFGIHIGLLQDCVGPAPVVFLAGLIGVSGWLPMHFALSPAFHWRCPYWLLCCLSFLQGHGQMAVDVAVVPTVARAFPEHRGLALGLVKSFVGLSGSIVTQMYLGLYRPHIVPFILFISVAVAICSMIGALVVRELPPSRSESSASAAEIRRRFGVAYGLTALLGVQLVGSALATQIWPPELETDPARRGLTGATVAILATILIFLAVQRDAYPAALAGSVQAPLFKAPDAAAPSLHTAKLRDFTVWEAALTLDFWILFLAFLLSSGAGLVLINNLGQIVPAIGERGGIEDTLVSILSVCNCLGRLACGAVGDLALSRWGTPRPVVFGWFILLMVVAMWLLAVAHPLALYGASAIGGLSYGAINGITPPIYSELFGLKSFGAIYTAGALAEAAGSFLMASVLFGKIYEMEARHAFSPAATTSGSYDGSSSSMDALSGASGPSVVSSTTCVGRQCFFMTAVVCAALCGVAVVLELWLGRRTQSRYNALYPRRHRTQY